MHSRTRWGMRDRMGMALAIGMLLTALFAFGSAQAVEKSVSYEVTVPSVGSYMPVDSYLCVKRGVEEECVGDTTIYLGPTPALNLTTTVTGDASYPAFSVHEADTSDTGECSGYLTGLIIVVGNTSGAVSASVVDSAGVLQEVGPVGTSGNDPGAEVLLCLQDVAVEEE